MKQIAAFFQFIDAQVEEASTLAIDQGDTQHGLGAEQRSQRLQVEAPVHEQLRCGQIRGQIKLAPQFFRAGGEHGFGFRLVAVQVAGDFEDAVEIGARAAVFTLLLSFAHGLAHQVLGENAFFFV